MTPAARRAHALAGATVAKSYKKTLSFIEEKQVLSKAKEVTDKVVGTVTKINDNYGISEKIDSKLKVRRLFTPLTAPSPRRRRGAVCVNRYADISL